MSKEYGALAVRASFVIRYSTFVIFLMNRASLLHIIERLEGFLGKLPETIRRPVLHELTPLKELFLQQRAPRFVLTGANRLPLQEIVAQLFAWTPAAESRDLLMELFRWHAIELGARGTVSFLDARGSDARTLAKIEDELKTQPADMLLHLIDDDAREIDVSEIDNLVALSAMSPPGHESKTIGIVWPHRARESRGHHNGEGPLAAQSPVRTRLENALQQRGGLGPHLLQVM